MTARPGPAAGDGPVAGPVAGRGPVKACLVDVWQTILTGDFLSRLAILTERAGVDGDAWLAAWLGIAEQRDTGAISVADSFATTVAACGVEPTPELIADLMRLDLETMRTYVRLYQDTVPFFTAMRAQGIAMALVSNCSETTRPLLEHLGVIPLADVVILSCEIGSAKPAPGIYQVALAKLGVDAADAVFIDDQPGFCAGAEAVGVRAIRIARPDLAPFPGQPAVAADFPVVTTLLDAPRHF